MRMQEWHNVDTAVKSFENVNEIKIFGGDSNISELYSPRK
jgi:hypothetical protein